jgi:C-terminal processing protease CtpA/Prc
MPKLKAITRYAAPLILCLVLTFTMAPLTGAQSGSDQGVVVVTGKVIVSNPFVLEDAAEPLIALIDLTAFVKRDRDMKLPYSDQTTAGLEGDLAQGAAFTLPLPIEPRAVLNDVSHGKGKGKGVAILAVDFDTNAVGDGYMGPYEWRGWPGGLDSLQFDPGTYEIAAGQLLVWAPDDQEMFPTGYGDDKKLFTDDDPVASIQKGWTVVNLDKTPFELIRQHTVEVPMLEGLSANNDLSKLSYTEAFDALVKDLRVRYTFTEFKHIDWDALVKEIRPLIEKAEKDKDKAAYNLALMRFAAKFKDGHLSVDIDTDYFTQQTSGGLGLVLGQTDDGVVIARIVLDSMPAAGAGIKAGAKILEWNGKPVDQALADTELLFATQSSPIATRLQQLRYIMRSPVDTKFTIKFQNPGEDAKTADLVAIKERQSFSLSSFNAGRRVDDTPIQVKVITEGDNAFGYIKINTFSGDSVLLTRSWEWALNLMKQLEVPALILDMRQNGGGSGLLANYFAGSFTKEAFVLNKSFQADKDGKFVYVGSDLIEPAPVQWEGPVAVLVGPACASACEIFSAAVAHDPKHLVVGRYPSAGVEAGVEPWTLPEGLYFQAPTTQIQTPDGKIFLEGVGVVPTVKVPVTVESLLSTDDQELPVAEKALVEVLPK